MGCKGAAPGRLSLGMEPGDGAWSLTPSRECRTNVAAAGRHPKPGPQSLALKAWALKAWRSRTGLRRVARENAPENVRENGQASCAEAVAPRDCCSQDDCGQDHCGQDRCDQVCRTQHCCSKSAPQGGCAKRCARRLWIGVRTPR